MMDRRNRYDSGASRPLPDTSRHLRPPTASVNACVDIYAQSDDSDFDFHRRKPSPSRPEGDNPPRAHPSTSPAKGVASRQRRQGSFGTPFGISPLDSDGLIWIDNQGTMAKNSIGQHKRTAPPDGNGKGFATGNCMTCASLMRWPKDLQVFKCTICATVNDLVPHGDGQQAKESLTRRLMPGRGGDAASSSSKTDVDKNISLAPISLEYSERLVLECLRSSIYSHLCDKPRRRPRDQPVPAELPHSYGAQLHPGIPLRNRGMSDSTHGHNKWQADNSQSNFTPQYVFDETPTLQPNHSSSSRAHRAHSSSQTERPHVAMGNGQGWHRREPSTGYDDDPKRIFKKVEDYVVKCFKSFECINSSFSTGTHQPVAHSESQIIPRKPVPTTFPGSSRSHEPCQATKQKYAGNNNLDPKLLLVGDVAEYGLWASGPSDVPQQNSAPSKNIENGSKGATTKSPHINWDGLSMWYHCILNAAQGWFGIYQKFCQDPNFPQPSEQGLRDFEKTLLDAQLHLQKVLMKMTETILKRPGRQITELSDMRFLLVLIENPLLHGEYRPFSGLLQDGVSRKSSGADRSAIQNHLPASGPLSGHHSGIVKRIIGLLSNTTVECHSQLIAWLSRYRISQFVKMTEFVSSFLTYRMIRQSDKKQEVVVDVTAGLIPEMQIGRPSAYLIDELGSSSSTKKKDPPKKDRFAEDWQIRAASRVLALIYQANSTRTVRRGEEQPIPNVSHNGTRNNDQLPLSNFYNSMVDNIDLVADFEAWEAKRAKFSFCQYPFLLSIWAKTRVLEFDARRQMQMKARDAFFDSIMTRKVVSQYLTLHIRRDCLVDDSLQAVSSVISSGGEDLKKGIRINFRGEEGIDGGGLRKEWFLLLARDVFNPDHGLFLYDPDSMYCYFNPNSFETADQFFLIGVVMGLAIYNSTILDVPLPPFTFRKLLASTPIGGVGPSAQRRPVMKYTLDDLAEYRPQVARGLRQLLDYDGDVETTFSLDFVAETDRYGTNVEVPLCPGGERKPVTNHNRKEFVDLYVRYMLDIAVQRQFEPFKRGFFTVCGGNAFSLFRPEEIELLVRGSDEAIDVPSLRAVAQYSNWSSQPPDGREPVVSWFWETFQSATYSNQRKLLLFITGSDRIPAMGAAMLTIKISCLGEDCDRFPIARTCFNMLSLWQYASREKLEKVLWRAVFESEGFGLK